MHQFKHYLDSQLSQRARLLQSLTLSVRSRIAPLVAEHCWVAGVHNDTLVILTDSGNWAVSIRYQQHEILKWLNAEYHLELEQTLKRLKLKVISLPSGGKNTISKPRLSQSSAQLIASAADAIQDRGLRFALRRLADHGESTKRNPKPSRN